MLFISFFAHYTRNDRCADERCSVNRCIVRSTSVASSLTLLSVVNRQSQMRERERETKGTSKNKRNGHLRWMQYSFSISSAFHLTLISLDLVAFVFLCFTYFLRRFKSQVRLSLSLFPLSVDPSTHALYSHFASLAFVLCSPVKDSI